MPAISLLFGVTFVASYILGPGDHAGFNAFALPGPAWVYLVAGIVLIGIAIWAWRKSVWVALDALVSIAT